MAVDWQLMETTRDQAATVLALTSGQLEFAAAAVAAVEDAVE